MRAIPRHEAADEDPLVTATRLIDNAKQNVRAPSGSDLATAGTARRTSSASRHESRLSTRASTPSRECGWPVRRQHEHRATGQPLTPTGRSASTDRGAVPRATGRFGPYSRCRDDLSLGCERRPWPSSPMHTPARHKIRTRVVDASTAANIQEQCEHARVGATRPGRHATRHGCDQERGR